MVIGNGEQVLVVDDDSSIGIMTGALLKCGGFEATIMDQSTLAVEALRKSKFNVLVTDLVMPGIDGLDLAREAVSLDSKIGVVLMTATPEDLSGKIRELRNNGVNIELLPKPFDVENLVGMVNKVRQSK